MAPHCQGGSDPHHRLPSLCVSVFPSGRPGEPCPWPQLSWQLGEQRCPWAGVLSQASLDQSPGEKLESPSGICGSSQRWEEDRVPPHPRCGKADWGREKLTRPPSVPWPWIRSSHQPDSTERPHPACPSWQGEPSSRAQGTRSVSVDPLSRWGNWGSESSDLLNLCGQRGHYRERSTSLPGPGPPPSWSRFPHHAGPGPPTSLVQGFPTFLAHGPHLPGPGPPPSWSRVPTFQIRVSPLSSLLSLS